MGAQCGRSSTPHVSTSETGGVADLPRARRSASATTRTARTHVAPWPAPRCQRDPGPRIGQRCISRAHCDAANRPSAPRTPKRTRPNPDQRFPSTHCGGVAARTVFLPRLPSLLLQSVPRCLQESHAARCLPLPLERVGVRAAWDGPTHVGGAGGREVQAGDGLRSRSKRLVDNRLADQRPELRVVVQAARRYQLGHTSSWWGSTQ